MFIESITLHNFRAYKGDTVTKFKRSHKNVYLIAGNNGFGKTTFLTSLVWCLYGKLMGEVDDKFKREILDSQGYKNFSKLNFNNDTLKELQASDITAVQRKSIQKNGYIGQTEALQSLTQYYVEMKIVDVFIPSIPCSSITIRRTYDYLLDTESVDVLIDGQQNELAKEVGYDIFINDFVLSKEIAKFFLFDAEKIVSLAEVKSLEEKRKLSYAYSEVLGIKKYEDIKRNLENLRIKFRKNANAGNAVASKTKLNKLTEEVDTIANSIQESEGIISDIDTRIAALRTEKEALQEKLIREGNAMSVDELEKQKSILATLKNRDAEYKAKLKEMLDIAPFAISGSLFAKMKEQVDYENSRKTSAMNSAAINRALQRTHEQIVKSISGLDMSDSSASRLREIISKSFYDNSIAEVVDNDGRSVLVDFSDSEANEFQALHDKIKFTFSLEFKQLVKDMKNNTLLYIKTQKRINAAEHDDGNAEIKAARERKAEIDANLTELEQSARTESERLGTMTKELSVKKKQLAEVLKTIRVDDMDKEKDEIAERLISELSVFLMSLKKKRKNSLATKIKSEMDALMHKSNFIAGVRIDIEDEIIEINLLDKDSNVIDKEKLSKGEQQLYATSILKALVDESGISFPVFIDSPLQKFDSIHAHNIITKFYPNVAKQVVIFPLLGKELSEQEYESLLPYVCDSFVISNNSGASTIKEVAPDKLFSTLNTRA